MTKINEGAEVHLLKFSFIFFGAAEPKKKSSGDLHKTVATQTEATTLLQQFIKNKTFTFVDLQLTFSRLLVEAKWLVSASPIFPEVREEHSYSKFFFVFFL